MAKKSGIFNTIASYLSEKVAPYFLAGSLLVGAAQYANAQNMGEKADSLVLTKRQYESLSVEEKARFQSLYYVSKDSSKGSQPMYALPGVYYGDPLYLRSVDRDSSVVDTSNGNAFVYIVPPDTNSVANDSSSAPPKDTSKVYQTPSDSNVVAQSKDLIVTVVKPKAKPINWIYSIGELTSAGDGVLAKSYINQVELAPGKYFSFKNWFSSKDKQRYYFTDAKNGLEKIARNMGPDSVLTGKEKAFKQYLKNLSRSLKSNDRASLRVLNDAVEDGVVACDEDSLYNEKGWKVKEGVYMAVVKTKGQSVPVLFRMKTSKLEKELTDEERIREAEEKQFGKKEGPEFKVKKDTLEADVYVPDQVDSSKYGPKGLTKEKWDRMNMEQRQEFVRKLDNKETIQYFGKVREWLEENEKQKKEEPVKETADSLITLERGFEFGPRALASNTGEVASEIFFNHPVLGKLRLGGFLGWSALAGKNYFENQSQSYNMVTRNVKNVSPTRTETRVDETFSSNYGTTKPVAEAGIELSYPVANYGDLSLGIGVKALREMNRKETRELSTITQEQNMVQTGQQVLTNNLSPATSEKNKFVPSWRIMTYADLTEWLKLSAIAHGVKDNQPNYGAGVSIDIGRILD